MNSNNDKNKKEDENEEDENIGFELGDKIHILGGRFDNTRGRIYYLDETLIRILPDGISDRLVDLQIEDGYLKEEYEIENLFVVSKRTSSLFVVQQDYRVGQLAEAFHGSDGNPVGKYIIEKVHQVKDSIELRDQNNDIIELEFLGKGIPLDSGIDVLRSRELPTLEKVDEQTEEEETAEKKAIEGEENEDFILGEEEEVEITVAAEIKEIASSMRNYPDSVQRSDMLQDLITRLNVKEQKSDKKIKQIRKITELCLLLRNELVAYGKNNLPLGKKATSIDTILDLVSNQNNNFSKPVLESKRTLYLDGESGVKDTTLNVDIRYLQQEINVENDYAKTQFVGNQNVSSIDILPNWYIGWDTFNKEHFISWSSKSNKDATQFQVDKEFFRIPYLEDIDTKEVDGLPKFSYPTNGKNYVPLTIDAIDSVLFSLLRGLKGRIGRLREKESPRLLESPEEGVVNSYLLFPKRYESNLGTTRSGKLAYDISRSMNKPKYMELILKEQNGISIVPSVGSILAVGNSSTGRILIEDWLKNLPLSLYGLGDALIELKSYGFQNKEFSYEQQNILVNKIEATIAHIKNHISYIREKANKELENQKKEFVNKNLLANERFEEIFTILLSEPILQQFISVIQKRLPYYKNNDVAIFAGLNHYAQDLLYAALAGYPDGLARFRNEFVNKQFVESLQHALLTTIKDEDKFYQPEENTCGHIKSLTVIQRVKDASDRMKLLSKFLTQYQSYKKDNFIYCVECDKHCLCEHEYLLLQEYLHPREKETIHKELLIRFSGGVFQGKFICNNCGQPISDLEFENSLEYSDDGVPLVGRSELVDKDALAEDEIEQALGIPIGNEKEIEFDTPAKTLYYQKSRELFDKVGIFPDAIGYIRIVNGVDLIVSRRPTREQYNGKIKEAEKAQGAKGQKLKAIDYDIYINRTIITAIISYSIIEIQTRIPNYIPRYSSIGCNINLRGYPLGKESDKGIIEYLSCVAASIIISKAHSETDDPWRLTRFQDERSDKKRQESIIKYIESILKEILLIADVQELLIKKKEYLLKTYGKKENIDGLSEKIRDGFTPFMYKEIDEVIVPDAANTYEKVRGYILETYKEAEESIKTESKEKGSSAFVERTCCFNKIDKPLEFWKNKIKIILPPKNVPNGPINSHSSFPFELRKEERLDFSVSKEDYYKLFIKVCYEGVRLGLPHEFGYNNICPYCGYKRATDEDSRESALKQQGVDVNETTYQKLLNAVHIVNSVKPDKKIKIEVGNELFQIITNIEPSPYEGWKAILLETFNNLNTLEPGSNDADIAVAYGKISSYAIQCIEELRGFISEQDKLLIEQLLEQPLKQVLESVESAILIPLTRILNGFNLDQLDVPRSYNLDGLIIKDIKKFISLHTEYLKNITIKGFGKSKIQYAVQQLSSFIKTFQNHVRIPLLKGGSIGIPYLVKAGIASILKDMMDPNVIVPNNELENDAIDGSSGVPKLILKQILAKYRSERFKLTDEDIRVEIAKRDEKEKMLIISKFDRLTKEEKAVELLKKKLGIGDWAIKAKDVYIYNPEQYEKDRDQRAQMGFADFPATAKDNLEREADNFYEQNAAYDTHQTKEDDY